MHVLDAEVDFLIVDTPNQLPALGRVARSADRVLVVTSVTQPARARTYDFVRRLGGTGLGAEIGIIANGVTSRVEAGRAYRAIALAAGRALRRHVEVGFVAADPAVPRAQMMQRAVVDCRPHAPSSRCFEALAQRIAQGEPFGGASLSLFPGAGSGAAPCVPEARQCA